MDRFKIGVLSSHGESVIPNPQSKFQTFFNYLQVLGFKIELISDNINNITQIETFGVILIGAPTKVFELSEFKILKEYSEEGGVILILMKYGGDNLLGTNISNFIEGIRPNNDLIINGKENLHFSHFYQPLINFNINFEGFQFNDTICYDGGCSFEVSSDIDFEFIPSSNNHSRPNPSYNYKSEKKSRSSSSIFVIKKYGKGKIIYFGARWVFSDSLIDKNSTLRSIGRSFEYSSYNTHYLDNHIPFIKSLFEYISQTKIMEKKIKGFTIVKGAIPFWKQKSKIPKGALFYPCSGTDTVFPFMLFYKYIDEFIFCDTSHSHNKIPLLEIDSPFVRKYGNFYEKTNDQQNSESIDDLYCLVYNTNLINSRFSQDLFISKDIIEDYETNERDPDKMSEKSVDRVKNHDINLGNREKNKINKISYWKMAKTEKKIKIVQNYQDARTFLRNMKPFSIFFYRKDSLGEGGSDINWFNEEYAPIILKKLLPGGLIVTDFSNAQNQNPRYNIIENFKNLDINEEYIYKNRVIKLIDRFQGNGSKVLFIYQVNVIANGINGKIV